MEHPYRVKLSLLNRPGTSCIEIVQLRQSLSHHSSTIVNSLGIALCYLDKVYLLTLIDIECEIKLEFLDVNLYCFVDISIDIEHN